MSSCVDDLSITSLSSTPSALSISLPETSEGGVSTASVTKRYNKTFCFRAITYEVCQKAGGESAGGHGVEERILFSVPIYGPSSTLAGEFEARFPTESEGAGSSAMHPLRIEGVNELEFCALLKVVYPSQAPALLAHEWLAVLKLAKRWSLPMLRTQALSHSDTITMGWSATKKITEGRASGALQWCIDGYKDIALRTDGMSQLDKKELGLDTYVRLLEIRDRAWIWVSPSISASKKKAYGRTVRSKSTFDINAAICDVFKDEMDVVEFLRPAEDTDSIPSPLQPFTWPESPADEHIPIVPSSV